MAEGDSQVRLSREFLWGSTMLASDWQILPSLVESAAWLSAGLVQMRIMYLPLDFSYLWKIAPFRL